MATVRHVTVWAGRTKYQAAWFLLNRVYLLRPCFLLSCKANARVKLAKTGHGPHSSKLVVICVIRLLFVLFCVLFVCKCVLPPGDNPTAVNKYIISYMSPMDRPPFHFPGENTLLAPGHSVHTNIGSDNLYYRETLRAGWHRRSWNNYPSHSRSSHSAHTNIGSDNLHYRETLGAGWRRCRGLEGLRKDSLEQKVIALEQAMKT